MGALRTIIIGGMSAVFALLGACAQDDPTHAAPPRATDPVTFPQQDSSIAVDLAIDLDALEHAIERDMPRTLWTIDRPGSVCVASKKVDLELFKVKSPKIKCRIVGKVTRGRVRLTGKGETLTLFMPVKGTLAARDIAGILKGETGTGAAEMALSLKLDLTPDWRMKGDAKLGYRWTREPGIDFLGRRVTFTSKADSELRGVTRDIERIITRELARVQLEPTAREGWREAHQVLELNRVNPEVWGRLTPEQFRFGGYEAKGRTLTLRLGLDAQLETFVGKKPVAVTPARLPPLARRSKDAGKSILHVPVIADYAVLEPVIAKALAKRAARPFEIEDYGTVTATFDDISVYGTGKGRIAVGGKFTASSDLPLIKKASGRIWLTALPRNAAGSRKVHFVDIKITGNTDITAEAFLFALANSPEFQNTITTALAQNFENDFNKLRAKIDRAIANRKGRLTEYSIAIETIQTGRINAHGEGLYLPVDITARLNARLLQVK